MSRCIVLLVTTLLVGSIVFAQDPATSDSSDDYLLDENSIAVLPVEVLSTDPGYVDIGDAIFSSQVGRVTAISGINVVDETSVRAFAKEGLTAVEIGRRLGARLVLESSVSRHTDGYHYRFALIDVASGSHEISGGGTAYSEWDAEQGLDEAIKDGIDSIAETVERRRSRQTAERLRYGNRKADARARLLDQRLSEQERLKALQFLAGAVMLTYPRTYADGGAALMGEPVLTAIQLAQESDNPRTRASIWNIMIGVNDPNLVTPLVTALQHDSDVRVRSRAAAALSTHTDDTSVVRALTDAVENDVDVSVRDAARLAVSTTAERHALLRRTVIDTDTHSTQRYRAMFNLTHVSNDAGFPADEELTAALVQWAQSASPRKRGMIWYNLGQIGGPVVVQPLVEALANEDDESIRESIIGALGQVINEPGARTAIEQAQIDDPSPLVRKTANWHLARAD
ncbi:MAG: HEAT repeat domain-containing protein [Pseudomonadota bacterium]